VKPQPDIAKPESSDGRFARGVELFNEGEYFDAHEIWEELWMDCPSAERRFVQALIQAAVALHHFERGNQTGAARLFRSGRDYMTPYEPVYRGLEIGPFWRWMEAYLAPALAGRADPSVSRPSIVLQPEGGDD
jgi:uncharacterized protein